MDRKKLNTTYEFEFYDGDKVDLTLTFYSLMQLSAKNKKAYERYNKIMSTNGSNELEMVCILYIAYLCAHLDEEKLLTEEEFMIKCGSDRMALKNAVEALLRPKKQ